MIEVLIKRSPLTAGALALVVIGFLAQAWRVDYNVSLDKKIDKAIEKSWDNDIERIEITGIDSMLMFPEEDAVFQLYDKEELVGYASLHMAYCCRIGGCAVWDPEEQNSGHDIFYYMVLANTDLTIRNITVLEYHSEYGYEITSKKWLEQFEGQTGCGLEYGEDVDGISGATISGESMVYNVGNTCTLLQQLSDLNLLAKTD